MKVKPVTYFSWSSDFALIYLGNYLMYEHDAFCLCVNIYDLKCNPKINMGHLNNESV